MRQSFYNKFCNLFKYGDKAHLVCFYFYVYITYLFIEFNEGWFKELLDFLSVMIWILNVTETFAHVGLRWQEVSLDRSWKSV